MPAPVVSVVTPLTLDRVMVLLAAGRMIAACAPALRSVMAFSDCALGTRGAQTSWTVMVWSPAAAGAARGELPKYFAASATWVCRILVSLLMFPVGSGSLP